MANKLRERGWLVPAYPMPANRQDLVVQRIVVKEGFSRDMADILLEDMRDAQIMIQEDILIWVPNIPGCICFLIASYLLLPEMFSE